MCSAPLLISCVFYFVLFFTFPAPVEVKADKGPSEAAETPGIGKTPSRMVTRLRNPDSKLSLLKNHQCIAAAHEANKIYKDGREVCVLCRPC